MRHHSFLLILLCIFSACDRAPETLVNINGFTMGTTYSIKLIANKTTVNETRLHADIETILSGINQSMSTYLPESELSLFNQAKNSNWRTISNDLYHVIEHANYVSQTTNGAFDITVGPLINLWGFGPDPFTSRIPDEPLLIIAKQHTGYEKLLFDKSLTRIAKSDPEIYIDLSAIAKGFAVDKIADYLEKNNIQHYLVEIGGELIGKGLNIDGRIWQVGIEQAGAIERSVQRIISLNNMAMATSGNYRNYFEKDGVRYSHTIDPPTAMPINHKLASVTVLTPSAMHADAMATAFMVLGTEQSHELANKLNIAVYTLSKTEVGFEEKYNDYFKPYLSSKSVKHE